MKNIIMRQKLGIFIGVLVFIAGLSQPVIAATITEFSTGNASED